MSCVSMLTAWSAIQKALVPAKAARRGLQEAVARLSVAGHVEGDSLPAPREIEASLWRQEAAAADPAEAGSSGSSGLPARKPPLSLMLTVDNAGIVLPINSE